MQRLLSFVLLLLVTLSCVNNPQVTEKALMTFKASGESAVGTRTYLDGVTVLWSAGDKISVFSPSCSSGEEYSISSGDEGKSEASFSGPSVEGGPWYAIYPADAAASCSESVLTMALPGVQHFSDGGFGPGENPMVAVSTDGKTLNFKNLCGIFCLKLKGSGNVKSITLKSAAEEALWGTASVAMNYEGYPVISMTQTPDEAHRTVSLDCGDGVALGEDPVQFCFVLPAACLGAGFEVSIVDDSGNSLVKSSTTAINIERSMIKRMAELDCNFSGSALLTMSEFGVYDLSGTAPEAVRVFTANDQLALRSGNPMTFRIQSLPDANALIIKFPDNMVEGNGYDLSVTSVGNTGVADATVNAVLLKKEAGKCWLEDSTNKVGYIIASEL